MNSMSELDTHDIDAVAGLYFVVGRATEGAPSCYRLSIVGIPGATDPTWGKAEKRARSGTTSTPAVRP